MAERIPRQTTEVRVQALEALETFLKKEDPESWESMTLQVVFCNPLGGYSFCDAVLTTQEMLSTFNCYPDQVSKTLPLKNYWDTEKLQNLIKLQRSRTDDRGEPSSKRQKSNLEKENIAFELLDNYLKEFAAHRLSLGKVLKRLSIPGKKMAAAHAHASSSTENAQVPQQQVLMESCRNEAAITKVLNTHIFRQLAVGDCLIDNHISTSGKCSCGCGVDVKKGNTSLGMDLTWHGFVDMMVNGLLPLVVLEEEDNTFEFEEPDQNLSLAVEVKKDIDAFSLKHRTGTSQLIAEAITNAFAQTNANAELLGLPIPAFGCTPDKIYIYSYDCKNDILLKKIDVLKIDEENLTPLTIVKIWLYIHFSLFMRRDSTDLGKHPDLKDYTAKFLSCNENVPRFYSKIQPGVQMFPRAGNEPTVKFVGLWQ